MALFDFIKKKEHTATTATVQKINEPYLEDLEKTNILFNLVQTPKAERDDKWNEKFLENIVQASFRAGDPQVETGPDGFPYFRLFLPEPHKTFQCFVIDRMKDDFLLTSGLGVVVNPVPNGADWVFSYGDILNLYLNKTFYTLSETPFSKETIDEVLAEDEEVMIGQPAESILPHQARKIIAAFLKANGVMSPRIALMMRHKKDGSGMTQDLVFNLPPEMLQDEKQHHGILHALSWYLPRHYSIVAMDEKSLGTGFLPL